MAVSSLTLPGNALATVNVITAPKKAAIFQVAGSLIHITFPYGPQGVDFDQLGLGYSEIARPDLKPILVANTPQLRTVTFDALIADSDTGGKLSVQSMLDDFETIADEDVDCEFNYGLVSLPFRVRLTKVSTTAIRRSSDGNITQASVSIQLTEVVAVQQRLVKLTAIVKTPTPKTSSPSSGPSSGPSKPATPFVGKACTSLNFTADCDQAKFLAAVEAAVFPDSSNDIPGPSIWTDRRPGPG